MLRAAAAMELTPLRYFVVIAAAGHMTRAARILRVSQPALSAAVKKLEADLGTDLLHRTPRGVELTEPGRVFLTHAQDIVRRADTARQDVRELVGLQTGVIRLGGGATATTYLLPPAVSAFRRQHPGLRFYVREAGSAAIAQAVSTGELDLGIVTLPAAPSNAAHANTPSTAPRRPPSPARRTPKAEGLVLTPLVQDDLRLITPPGHRLAGRRAFRWADVAGEPFVGFEAGTAVRDVIDSASTAAGVTLSVVMELRSIESIKQMVAAGIGVGLVSRFALPAGQGLVCKDGPLSRSLALARSASRMPSPAAAAFQAILARSLATFA